MFLEYYKLREQPFGVTPDPRYLYFSPGHREALATLFYGIETGRGFLSLIAEPGMGKTTLLFQLLKRWKGYVHSAFLFQTQCDSRELIRYLLEDLGVKNDADDVVRMHSELNEFLFRETKAGRRVVLFIDEAQNLSDTVLETVRLLTNFEAADRKLLQIVLAGQPELAQRLSRPGLAQLRQRIAVQARLDPLPAAEVARYVKHRLHVAGREGGELFTPAALATVADLSRGIPRLINVLCFNALSLAFATRRQQISSDVVTEAAADLALEFSSQRAPVQQALPMAEGQRRVRSSSDSLASKIKGFYVRRLAQISALLLLFSGVAVLVGAHTYKRNSAAPIPAAVKANEPNNTVGNSNAANSSSPSLAGEKDRGRDAIDSFTYVVQPNDTIRELSESTFGRYDDNIRAEVRRLNPGLKDFERLQVGQEIRLPLSNQKRQAERPGPR